MKFEDLDMVEVVGILKGRDTWTLNDIMMTLKLNHTLDSLKLLHILEDLDIIHNKDLCKISVHGDTFIKMLWAPNVEEVTTKLLRKTDSGRIESV